MDRLTFTIRTACTALIVAILSLSAAAQAQPQRLSLIPFLSNLSEPVFLTHANDGSGRVFIVEQAGRIRVLQPGAAAPTLFLDITARVLSGGERGLLGLTFHPQFSQNGRFYVNYTRRPDGATVVAEYSNGAEQRILFTVAQPYENHNGGMVEFGPDGYLYIGMGDGGSANDPQNRAQNLNELLGKMLRINVDVPNSRPEIYAYGLRNPWRFSFDRLTGQLYAGDVGQSAREEIDIVTQGGNYGWRVWEGTVCTGLGPAPCLSANFIPPIAEYVTGSGGRCAIIGGYVYRGKQASLPDGAYVYGDLCSGEILMLKDGVQTVLTDTPLQITSFGEDEAGEIYVMGTNGSIFRLANPDVVNTVQRAYVFSSDSAFVATTAGTADGLVVGYGRIQPEPGQAVPSGVAIFSFKQRGVLVSETSVPASRAITAGRLFAEVGVNVNTGIALVNPNEQVARVTFYFTDTGGANFGEGVVNISPKQQIAAFLNEAPFNGRPSITGTFTFTASVPIAAIGLRGVTNERGDFLITTLPVGEIGTTPPANTIAHYADGGGWTTQVLLVNPSDAPASGSVQFVGRTGEVFQTSPYSVAARSSVRIVTSGSGSDLKTGSIRISSGVFASSVLSFRVNGVTVTQAGVVGLRAGTAFQMYVENGSAVRSGIALANPSAETVDVTLETGGLSTTVTITPNSQTVMFLNELPGFSNLPLSFRGVLRITSNTPIAVTGVRSHVNERGEFLIATTAPADESTPGDAEVFFPHFADGAGYSMQFILFGRASSGTISFYDPAGNPLPVQFR